MAATPRRTETPHGPRGKSLSPRPIEQWSGEGPISSRAVETNDWNLRHRLNMRLDEIDLIIRQVILRVELLVDLRDGERPIDI